MRRTYISPKIKKVEFKVEIGLEGSVTELNSFGGSEDTDWAANPNQGDGTETYFGNRSF